jgi:hypothetical protein
LFRLPSQLRNEVRRTLLGTSDALAQRRELELYSLMSA